MKKQSLFVALALVLALSISAVSAAVPATTSHPLNARTEVAVRGGMDCDGAIGVGAGFALGALTPCSIVCAVGAWYSLALVAYAC